MSYEHTETKHKPIFSVYSRWWALAFCGFDMTCPCVRKADGMVVVAPLTAMAGFGHRKQSRSFSDVTLGLKPSLFPQPV